MSNCIKNGIKVVNNVHPDILWLKLKKDLPRNFYVCFTYVSPSDSVYHTNKNFESADLFNWIRQDCAEFISKGNLLLMGDFNAYLPENFVDYIDNDHVLPVNIYNPNPAAEKYKSEWQTFVRNVQINTSQDIKWENIW